jgi:phospholipid/cholesterol/gamma-HCH transport system ATP-binding protein
VKRPSARPATFQNVSQRKINPMQQTSGREHASTSGVVPPPAVEVEHLSFAFDDHVILRNVSLTVPRGSMTIILGASGAGKSILLKLILGLYRPDSGQILVNGERIDNMPERDLLPLRADIGMLFQESALFDSLTVAENVGYRLYEETDMPMDDVRARIEEVLGFIGLRDYIDRMPSALSGGQRRRVAIARAMASRPHLLLFDDPTTGLDPITATTVDDEIVKLRDLEHVTSLLVTHQIRDAHYVATHEAVKNGDGLKISEVDPATADRARFIVLHEGRILFEGNVAELLSSQDSYLREFLFMTLPPW